MQSKAAIAAAASKLRVKRPKPARVEVSTPTLDSNERCKVVDTMITLVDGLYAHLPQKRAMYGHDPVQRLRLLRQRIPAIDENDFHRTLAEILTDLRDAHTRYLGPLSEHRRVAVLPLLVETYEDDRDESRYIVSKIFSGDPTQKKSFAASAFEEGVEVTHWNGVPIDRAVELYAERETGGRPDARKARALESLTIRPLRYALPPDEDWVIISFRTLKGGEGEVRVEWSFPKLADRPFSADLDGTTRRAYAGNPAAEAARRAKKMLFAPDKWHVAETGKLPTLKRSVALNKKKGKWFSGAFEDNVTARLITTKFGRFGHLRLWSFDLRDDDGFINEIVDLVNELPQEGIIIDLRGNPGGLIWAAERMLQLFTPNTIEPTRFSLLATDLTRAMAAARQGDPQFDHWRRSLDAAVTNGELYSRSIPLTPPNLCNDRGQQYPGPVVAIVDANTYSAGDLFAAGFVDNRVGALVSVGEGTGAGGANVWYPEHVNRALANTGYELADLPAGISYTISLRRAVRIGDIAGTAIEDVGIAGDERRSMTKRDLIQGNVDLLDFCCGLLASEIVTNLNLDVEDNRLKVHTDALDRVDVFVDDRPFKSEPLDRAADPQVTPFDLPSGWRSLEVLGLIGEIVRQRRRVGP